MPVENTLALRLKDFPDKRWKTHEAYKIISEFLIAPKLAHMIETLNKVHRVQVHTAENGHIRCLSLQSEKDKKPGLWYNIKRFFAPYEDCVDIWANGQLFLCEYYKHSFFEFCDQIKVDYDANLKGVFGWDLVIVCRAK